MRYLGFLLILCACTGSPDSKENKSETIPVSTPASEIKYSKAIFRNDDGSFGYDLLKDSSLVIRQKTIPVKNGMSGFKDSITAARVAAFAISRMEAGVFPPTIQETEIDSILKIK